eukprot:3130216-Pyramimonas_sp.AAC.1
MPSPWPPPPPQRPLASACGPPGGGVPDPWAQKKAAIDEFTRAAMAALCARLPEALAQTTVPLICGYEEKDNEHIRSV